MHNYIMDKLHKSSALEDKDKESVYVASQADKFFYIICNPSNLRNMHPRIEEIHHQDNRNLLLRKLAQSCSVVLSDDKFSYEICNGLPENIHAKLKDYLSNVWEIKLENPRPLPEKEFNFFKEQVSKICNYICLD